MGCERGRSRPLRERARPAKVCADATSERRSAARMVPVRSLLRADVTADSLTRTEPLDVHTRDGCAL